MGGKGGARRLLYCSTVAPQPTGAGELLAYRHLRALTGWEVMTVVCEHKPTSADLRAEPAMSLPLPPRWLQRIRRGPFFGRADQLTSHWFINRFATAADHFQPAVVLSVMVPDVLMTAAALYARRRALPFALLCHDDYASLVPRSGQELLARAYRQASVRLCVSRVMEAEFLDRYGVHGDILAPIPSGPPKTPRITEQSDALVIGFAGAIGYGYVDAFMSLADALAEEGGRLVIASPTPRQLFERLFSHPAVSDLGVLPPSAVRSGLLRSGVNVLSVIQSFAEEDIPAFRLNFPSKLTEYATYGLPVFVVAPENASASAWMKDNPGSALAIHSTGRDEMIRAVRRLKEAGERRTLAHGFHAAAKAFDPDLLQRRFENALSQACQGTRLA